MSEDITLLANPFEIREQKEAPIVQTGETISMTINQTKERVADSLIQSMTQTMDGIDSLNETEEMQFDDYCEVDYDLDYTVQY